MKPLAAALAVIRLISGIVPRWRRGDWEREWRAELHAQANDDVSGSSTVLARSAGAFADAFSLRSQAMYLDLWLGDLRFAWRAVARRPAFTSLVVLTLALGIGVNSAVFALVDAVLLRPLPYRDPSRLAFVWQTLPEHSVFELEATPFDYDAWHQVRSFSQIALVAADAFTLTGNDNPERVRGSRVTASLMPTLGIAPKVGRAFTPEEDISGSEPVVILSDGLWRRRYGGDPTLLGRTIQVNGLSRTVIGVMPRATTLPGPLAGDDELWLPAEMTAEERTNDVSHNYTVLARLADGTSAARATAELEAFAARMTSERPSSHRGLGVRLTPLAEQAVVAIRPTLLVIAGGVAILLLVACANASTLLIARASNRRHELAVRTALGATRSRLASLAITECLILSVLGGLTGLVLGGWALRGLLPLFAETLPESIAVAVDARVALFTAAISCVLGIVFGAIVAAHGPEDHLSDSLKTSGRTTTAHRAARARSALVVAQVALSVVLLSATGLMLSSVVKLSHVGTGFAADHVLTTRIALTGSNYSAAPSRIAFAGTLLERLQSAPGVTDAALTSTIPFGGSRGANGIDVEGRPTNPGEILIVDQRHVSPGYFQAMKIPLLRGRTFTSADDSRAERVVVINREMANLYWPGGNPIDKRVRLRAGSDSGPWIRIVGVAENVRHISLSRAAVPEMPSLYTGASRHVHAGREDAERTVIDCARRSGESAGRRSRPPGLRRTHDGRSYRSLLRADARHDASAAGDRGPRDGAGGGGHLRLDLVLGQPAAAGDRHQAGARRHPRVGVRERAGERRGAHVDRRRHRRRRSARRRAADRGAALRHRANRSSHLPRRRRRSADAGGRRQYRPGAARDERRSDLGASRRVN